MIGKKISPILAECEGALWEFEAMKLGKPNFTNDGFRAACKIFMSAMMDKMWELQSNENIPLEIRCEMAERCGEDIRKLIKTYTNLDSTKFYDNPLYE